MVIYLVLLSTRTRSWKITDFGLTAEGTSRCAYTTRSGRGTACYRAPELIRHLAVVSMKSDIWALGCIIYELISGRKVFQDDIYVYEFASNHHQFDDPIFPEQADRRFRAVIGALLQNILVLDWWKRPSAREILNGLQIFSPAASQILMYTAWNTLDPQTESSTIEDKDHSSWEGVQWVRYWYMP